MTNDASQTPKKARTTNSGAPVADPIRVGAHNTHVRYRAPDRSLISSNLDT